MPHASAGMRRANSTRTELPFALTTLLTRHERLVAWKEAPKPAGRRRTDAQVAEMIGLFLSVLNVQRPRRPLRPRGRPKSAFAGRAMHRLTSAAHASAEARQAG